ncbi:MAG: porin family protein [Candidatus Aminicenantes bacterium]|nr:porin family protein [Candidatus Aminicenantes bacterium]
MKKLRILLIFIVFFSGISHASKFTFEVKVSYFSPTEKAFKDIYGGGMTFGAEVSIGLWKKLQFWFGENFYSGDGGLTYTEEETSLQILPIGGGLKYEFSTGTLRFYGGIGVNLYNYRESNVLGEVMKSGLGYIGKIGVYIQLTKGLLIDIFSEYTYCKMIPADFTINIGGITVGLGLGYKF